MIEKNFWDLTDEEFEARSYSGTLTNEEAKKMDAEIRESRKRKQQARLRNKDLASSKQQASSFKLTVDNSILYTVGCCK
jgi:hypothetical protein